MIIKSETIGKLAEALSKAQGAMSDAVKDTDNPFFKRKYADLASVRTACKKELVANGLSVVQLPTTKDGKLALAYVLMHSSGEYLGDDGLEMPPTKNDPQGFGSALTYARRYTLAAVTGVATEDDDGNAASVKNGSNGQDEGFITHDQVKDLEVMLTDVHADLAGFLDYMQVGSLKDIRKRQWQTAITAIEAKKRRK